MSRFSVGYKVVTNSITIEEYIPGAGSVNGCQRHLLNADLAEALVLREGINESIEQMKIVEKKSKENIRQALTNEKSKLLAQLADIQNKLDKGEY